MENVVSTNKQELAQLLTGIHGSLMCSVATLGLSPTANSEAVSQALLGAALLADQGLNLLADGEPTAAKEAT